MVNIFVCKHCNRPMTDKRQRHRRHYKRRFRDTDYCAPCYKMLFTSNGAVEGMPISSLVLHSEIYICLYCDDLCGLSALEEGLPVVFHTCFNCHTLYEMSGLKVPLKAGSRRGNQK